MYVAREHSLVTFLYYSLAKCYIIILMNTIEIILIAIGLAMDAFAVSICKGLSMKKMQWNKAVIIGLYFGVFQGVMPIIGYFLGYGFSSFVDKVDHFIAFGLLAIIGVMMIVEAFKQNEEYNDKTDVKTMLALAVATSIDALAVGVSSAMVNNSNIFIEAAIIAVITFALSFAGVKIGNVFGDKWGSKAKFVGGCILILIGVRILITHLMAA